MTCTTRHCTDDNIQHAVCLSICHSTIPNLLEVNTLTSMVPKIKSQHEEHPRRMQNDYFLPKFKLHALHSLPADLNCKKDKQMENAVVPKEFGLCAPKLTILLRPCQDYYNHLTCRGH